MGGGIYCSTSRMARSTALGYDTKSVSDIFTQSKVGAAHESMNPKGISFRECRTSEDHPNARPVIIGLDVTGSMYTIPHQLIKNGLPTLMGGLIESGYPDEAVLFLGIGDHVTDDYPIQIGQFESADEELDLWLTRTYLEGGGGGNRGESYSLAWEFAANRVQADAFENGVKGTLITIGDEPCLDSLPENALKNIYGEDLIQEGYSDLGSLLEKVKKNWNVYHIIMTNGSWGSLSTDEWRELLGDNAVEVASNDELPRILTDIISKDSDRGNSGAKTVTVVEAESGSTSTPVML